MARPAEFTACGLIISHARKLKLSLTDRPRQNFHNIVRAIEGQRVYRISAGDAKMNRNSSRNQNAMRNEQILFRDHAHCDRTVQLLLGPQITLDKLSRQLK